MKTQNAALRSEMKIAAHKWPGIGKNKVAELRALIQRHRLSIALGDVALLDANWYVTHAGLLRLAHRNHCSGMKTTIEKNQSDSIANRWVFRAVVYKSGVSKGFVGYGDANPSNVSPLVRGAEMRIAETRAVNRALRKAYGIGLCSVEELGWNPRSEDSSHESTSTKNGIGNGSGNGVHANHQPRLRDRLCLLIRQHRLDPNLVKSYAADFCGTAVLREATRERLEEFVNHLSKQATTDRDALLCQLNSFNSPQEVQA